MDLFEYNVINYRKFSPKIKTRYKYFFTYSFTYNFVDQCNYFLEKFKKKVSILLNLNHEYYLKFKPYHISIPFQYYHRHYVIYIINNCSNIIIDNCKINCLQLVLSCKLYMFNFVLLRSTNHLLDSTKLQSSCCDM